MREILRSYSAHLVFAIPDSSLCGSHSSPPGKVLQMVSRSTRHNVEGFVTEVVLGAYSSL